MAEKKVNLEQKVETHTDEHSTKGAFAASMIFVGGFILFLYIAIYWLFMVRVDL
ncbi:hypothetical protein SAMN05216389_1067 [Oceanobacillus limi]|uniref:Cytochrome c oxidase subunit IIa family protein n=1 Tax=Oceanobacillus limi TaxID=930131 RepID=A0A1I0C419_9BACI|nr:hypothetical protein [Oceanobacillus limi]SET13885.1 hypothetical protein SAMN05216389_1067 [Oceanobacillus limi]